MTAQELLNKLKDEVSALEITIRVIQDILPGEVYPWPKTSLEDNIDSDIGAELHKAGLKIPTDKFLTDNNNPFIRKRGRPKGSKNKKKAKKGK